MGNERSEILTVESKTATQLTLSAAQFPHDADDPIYALEVDQVRIYRSTTGANGSYTVLATVAIDVDNENNRTVYKDANALDTYYYKIAFRDSVGDTETERTPAIAATGFTEKMVGTIVSEVSRELKDRDFLVMDIPSYISHLNSINDDLLTQAKRPYRFLKKSTQLNLEADASTTAFPDDLWKINYVEVNEVAPASSATYRPKKVSPTEARFQLTQQSTPGDYVNAIAYDDEERELIVVPKARSQRLNAFNLHYYQFFPRITSLSDAVLTPNTLVYKLGLKRDFYYIKADDDDKYLKKAMEYEKKYQGEVMKLQREKNIDAGGPEGLSPDKKRYPQWGGRRYRQ